MCFLKKARFWHFLKGENSWKKCFFKIFAKNNFFFTSTSRGHNFFQSGGIFNVSTDSGSLVPLQLMNSWSQEDLTTLQALKWIFPNVRCESGVPAMKISNCLFLMGFRSNLVQFTKLSLEKVIGPIFGDWDNFRALRRIGVFSALA